ncbi:MAG: hypothetical protein Q9220_005369 [cf. Caloplaca sp. 1 TL-2023]
MAAYPENPNALLKQDLEKYLTALAFHVRGLTPWGLAIFFQEAFPHGRRRIKSGPDVCWYMHELEVRGPQYSHGFYAKWKYHLTMEMDRRTQEALAVMTDTLQAVVQVIKPRYVGTLIYDNHHRTIYEQMQVWNMVGPFADQRGFANATAITTDNELRFVEEAKDYLGQILLSLYGNWANEVEFVAHVAYVHPGATAFRLAQAHDIIFPRPGEPAYKDVDVYNIIRQLPENYATRFALAAETNKANAYCRLYELARKEVVLYVGVLTQYEKISSWQELSHNRDRAALEHWEPEDVVNAHTIIQQIGPRRLARLRENARLRDLNPQITRPVAQHIFSLQQAVENLKGGCWDCDDRDGHGVAPCYLPDDPFHD